MCVFIYLHAYIHVNKHQEPNTERNALCCFSGQEVCFAEENSPVLLSLVLLSGSRCTVFKFLQMNYNYVE